MEEENNIQAAIEAGRMQNVQYVTTGDDGTQYIVIPNNYIAHQVPSINPVLSANVDQSVTLVEQGSFIDYIKRFGTDCTIIKARVNQGAMLTIIDYHQASGDEKATPNYCQHSALFECGFDEDYKPWRKINNAWLDQTQFAYFIEENLHTIAEPSGADLLDMAQNLKINRGVVFKNNKQLKDGTVDIGYTETDEADGGKGGFVRVPNEITVATPIYMMRQPQAIAVKLRYRVEKGQSLKFRLDITRKGRLEFKAFKLMTDEVAKATKCPVYLSA